MTAERTEFQQKRANALKTLRSAIRLKYSILADEELNRRLPAFDKQFAKAWQDGVLLDPLSVKKVLSG